MDLRSKGLAHSELGWLTRDTLEFSMVNNEAHLKSEFFDQHYPTEDFVMGFRAIIGVVLARLENEMIPKRYTALASAIAAVKLHT